MFLNSIFFSLLFLYTGKPQANDSLLVEEYVVTFKNGNPEDTALKGKSFYDSHGNLLKEISFYKDKILQTTIYLNKNTTDIKKYLSKSDSIVYSIKSKDRTTKIYNGKVIGDIYYDKNNNIIKEVSYNINSDRRVPVTTRFVYLYDRNKKKTSETFLWNKDTIHEIKYTYTKDSLLSEKYYLRNKCCEGNQPIPVDKILYEYDSNRNLVKEIEVVDRSVKRKYKDRFNGYYNKTITTTYLYDSENRMVDKRIYTPNLSEDARTKINELHTQPSVLSEEYIYKYR